MTNTVGKRLRELQKKAPKMVEKALGQVALRMMRDFVMDTPAAPVLTGNLRGSSAVFVNTTKVADGEDLPKKPATKLPKNFVKIKPPVTNDFPEKNTVLAVINVPYAARMDQNLVPYGKKYKLGPFSLQAGNVGGGFISSKVASKKYQERWKKIFSKEINENFQ